MSGDQNAILRAHIAADTGLVAIVSTRIYCPRLPEGTVLPALAFFIRGGTANPHIPPLPEPSFQFDCWGRTPQEARSVYTALYDCLQGLQNQAVVVGGSTYFIKSAIEEVQGQDVQEIDHPGYCRVLTFFRIMIRI